MKALTVKRIAGFIVVGSIVALFLAFSGGCSPQPSQGDIPQKDEDISAAEGDTSESGQYGDSFTWSSDADCVVCHASEAGSLADDSTLVGSHFTEEGLGCADCHSDDAKLAAAHEGKTSSSKTPTRLRTTKVEEATCLECHESYSALSQITASSTALTDLNGTVVNPHDLPVNDDHAIISCTSCHVMHKNETAQDASMALCTSCHHEKVFECGTCHT